MRAAWTLDRFQISNLVQIVKNGSFQPLKKSMSLSFVICFEVTGVINLSPLSDWRGRAQGQGLLRLLGRWRSFPVYWFLMYISLLL